ncbi:MAG: hypothetical protein KDC67_13230, partial [Ignavibacteriae bacterium]|nr:hypothetical protein [Ignavibacteriota bacterium]
IVELWNSYFNPRLKSGQSGYVYMPAAMYHLLSNKLDIKSTLKAISMVKENSILDNKGKPCRVQLRKLTDLFLGGMPVLNGIVPLNNVEVAEPISRKESNRNAAGEIKDEKKETSKKKVAKKSKSSTKK